MLPGSLTIRLEHLRGAGAERAVDEALQAADAHPVVAEAGLDAQRRPSCCQSASGQRRSMRSCQLALAGQLLVETEQPAARRPIAAVHVLHAGDADLPRLGQGGADGLGDLVVGRRRDELVDQVHGVVAQHAGGLLACRACDR